MNGKYDPEGFKRRVLDKISPTFCAAKFLSGTIWLGSGRTASCHHCSNNVLNPQDVSRNPSRLFNSVEKKRARELMLKGERPAECSYCWDVEDLKPEAPSDRVCFSHDFGDRFVEPLKFVSPQSDILPRSLEIAFDRNCQFACSYCGPLHSSRWRKDIHENGAYNIESDVAKQFSKTFDEDFRYEDGVNPYVDGFWTWWPELKVNLNELRLTGGEPLLSADAWRLMEDLAKNPVSHLRFGLNSNLAAGDKWIHRLADLAKKIPKFFLYTSCEAWGTHAEYIREGLNFSVWQKNLEFLLEKCAFERVIVTMTINALSLESLPKFLDYLVHLKCRFGEKKIEFNPALLKFPRFQTFSVLPMSIRQQRAIELGAWQQQNVSRINFYENEGLRRLIAGLGNESDQLPLQKDFKKFFVQYDLRRGKNYSQTFSGAMKDWYEAL